MANVNDIMNEIDRIEGAKGGLAGAIEEKGVEVPAGAKIDEYPGLVRQIQQGGTSDCVKFTPQTLSAAEQAQARANIGAQEVLTFDTEPVEGSTNPITSGGVYDALQIILDAEYPRAVALLDEEF